VIILLFVVAVNALVAGWLFMTDPSGQSMGISAELLRFSSFDNFFLPGLVLFSMNGVLAIITAISVIRRWSYYPVRVTAQGMLLTGWIMVQVMLIREFNFLHAILGASGIYLILTGISVLRKPAA